MSGNRQDGILSLTTTMVTEYDMHLQLSHKTIRLFNCMHTCTLTHTCTGQGKERPSVVHE